MKTIVPTTSNICAAVVDGKMIPQIEVGLVLSETGYRPDHGSGSVNRYQRWETVRFAADPETLRQVAAGLIEYANDGEAAFHKALVNTETQKELPLK